MLFINSWLIAVFGLKLINCMHTWSFEIKDIYGNSSNPNVVDFDVQVVRVSRGVIGLKGFVDIKEDYYDTLGQLQLYRSSTGQERDYKLSMYGIQNITLIQFMNTVYKEHMAKIHECEPNAPKFEIFEPPIKKANYKFDNCVITMDGMPNFMAEGLYKAVTTVFSENFTVFGQIVVMVENSIRNAGALFK